MPGLIGKKIGMTSIFTEEGENIPCTILEVGPCTVTQIKNEEVDGYNAVQIGYEEQKDNRISKSLKGHFSKAKSPNLKKLIEFGSFEEVNLGDTLTNARKLINHVYHILERKNTDDTSVQLFEGSMRALTHFVQENELIGEEYTVDNMPSENEVIEASKGRGEVSATLTGPALQRQIAALKIQINRFIINT